MPGRRFAFLVVLLIAGQAVVGEGSSETAKPGAVADDERVRGNNEFSGAGSPMGNPHSDLIFRATGAKSCRDCHKVERDNSLSPQVLDNELIRNLHSKAKGIHGPGRFADCLRCHAGGRKGVEKY